MRVWMQRRALLDMVTEGVAVKSGILLTDHDIVALLESTPMAEWAAPLVGEPDEEVGARPDYVEDLVRAVRAGIGNLPDATPGNVLHIQRTQAWAAEGRDPWPVLDAIFALMRERIVSGGADVRVLAAPVFGPGDRDLLVARSGSDPRIVDDVLNLYAEIAEREWWIFGESQQWDGRRSLSDLFDVEAIPADADVYLDQRFLDFLAAREERLDAIHWRNFERLVAEYFRRAGHEVVLGRGTKDGGVDVRVWPDAGRVGPPLLLVQCKRYGRDELVKVEHVKAFWTDVHDEQARGGLIATTARVSPDGKRVAEARKYPLSFAEGTQVKQWVRSMWRHSWSGERRTVGLGRYVLPPAIIPGRVGWDPLLPGAEASSPPSAPASGATKGGGPKPRRNAKKSVKKHPGDRSKKAKRRR